MRRGITAVLLAATFTLSAPTSAAVAVEPSPTPSPGLIGGLVDGIVDLITGPDATPAPTVTPESPKATADATPRAGATTPVPVPAPGRAQSGRDSATVGEPWAERGSAAPAATEADRQEALPPGVPNAQDPPRAGSDGFILASTVTVVVVVVLVAVGGLLIWRRRAAVVGIEELPVRGGRLRAVPPSRQDDGDVEPGPVASNVVQLPQSRAFTLGRIFERRRLGLPPDLDAENN